MAGRTLDIEQLITPDNLASQIANYQSEWNSARASWLDEKQELRNYLFATDTKTTTNNKLPWSNSTTVPKLTQLRDNLHANYIAALFPTSGWLRWEAEDADANTTKKKDTIAAYMKNKLRQSGFMQTVSKQIYDYIDWGMVFGIVKHRRDTTVLPTGQLVEGYVGPYLSRISPYDIVFNPVATEFRDTPKIIREIKSLGDIAREAHENPENNELAELLNKIKVNRQYVLSYSENQIRKGEAFTADGFGNLHSYYKSGWVEFLTFYGSLFDTKSGTLYHNHEIQIVDRAFVVYFKQNPSWLGHSPIYSCGWRERPDNLYAMGPLDNLVGMQYRMDHLENLRADVFDQIALPMMKIRGEVEEFKVQPGGRIYLDVDSDVEYLQPQATALQADFQMDRLENKMEEFAGAPRQAMGIRTPGEKTAFEVQVLENSAGRIFQHKTSHIEQTYIEPVLNCFLETGRRNMEFSEDVRIDSPDTGASLFVTVNQDDLLGRGRISPIGARHFAERARRVQNISNMLQIKAADPTVGVHLSGKMVAQIIADELGEPNLYGENIAIIEQMDTQRMAQETDQSLQEEEVIASQAGF